MSFAGATRRITGSPTTTHATREVTYTVSDASTPAKTIAQTFQFPVVSAAALMTLDDWDNLGYGLPVRGAEMLLLIEAGDDVPNTGNAHARMYRIPPRGTAVGTKIDDPHEDIGIGILNAVLTDIRINNGGGTVLVNDSNTNVDGDTITFHLGNWASGTDRYFYIKTSGFEIKYNHATNNIVSQGDNFLAWTSVGTQQASLRTIAETQRVIFAVAAG